MCEDSCICTSVIRLAPSNPLDLRTKTYVNLIPLIYELRHTSTVVNLILPLQARETTFITFHSSKTSSQLNGIPFHTFPGPFRL